MRESSRGGLSKRSGGEPDTTQRAKRPECPEPLPRARRHEVRESTAMEEEEARAVSKVMGMEARFRRVEAWIGLSGPGAVTLQLCQTLSMAGPWGTAFTQV